MGSNFTQKEILSHVSECLASRKFCDVVFQCRDGVEIPSHRLVLASVSSFLKETLKEYLFLPEREPPTFIIPDVRSDHLSSLLGIIYGSCDDQTVGDQVWVSLESLAKMLGIELVVPPPRTNHPASVLKPMSRTRSGWKVKPTSEAKRLIGSTNHEPEVKPKSLLLKKKKAAAASSAGLGSLVSVAEAFERSQRPDFNELVSGDGSVVTGTDTESQLVKACALCGKRVLGRHAYGRHMRNVHPKMFGPYSCPFPGCEKQLEEGAEVLKHLHVHLGPRAVAAAQGRKFECRHCDANYTTSSRLNQHLKVKHGAQSGSKLTCNAGCEDGGFPNAKAFTEHMLTAHQLNPWLCQLCGKRFKDKQNYSLHKMSSHEERIFPCDICAKVFRSPRQLYNHRALHLGRKFLCPHCGFSARSSQNLRGHVKVKHEAKTLECEVCNKRFGTSNNLRNHMRVHTGQTPFACDLCGVKFKRNHHLQAHVQSKIHAEVVEKRRTKGEEVPSQLDPSKKCGRTSTVEGVAFVPAPTSSIIIANDHQPSLKEPILYEVMQTSEQEGGQLILIPHQGTDNARPGSITVGSLVSNNCVQSNVRADVVESSMMGPVCLFPKVPRETEKPSRPEPVSGVNPHRPVQTSSNNHHPSS